MAAPAIKRLSQLQYLRYLTPLAANQSARIFACSPVIAG
jgi:hypothetical protein